jgi:hypothetical protein
LYHQVLTEIDFNPSEILMMTFALGYVIQKMKADPVFDFQAPASIEGLESAAKKIDEACKA